MSDTVITQVLVAIAAVCARKGLPPAPLAAQTPLDGTIGLDSLDFAEVIVRLEQVFGFDPFSERPIDQLATIGDLAALYYR